MRCHSAFWELLPEFLGPRTLRELREWLCHSPGFWAWWQQRMAKSDYQPIPRHILKSGSGRGIMLGASASGMYNCMEWPIWQCTLWQVTLSLHLTRNVCCSWVVWEIVSVHEAGALPEILTLLKHQSHPRKGQAGWNSRILIKCRSKSLLCIKSLVLTVQPTFGLPMTRLRHSKMPLLPLVGCGLVVSSRPAAL